MKLQRDYSWSYDTIDGYCFDLGSLFSHMELDEIIDSLRKVFDGVELIDEMEIEDYLN